MTSTFEMPEPIKEETSAVDETTPLPNESSPAAFFRVVRKLGREAALGRDSLPALVGTIAEAVGDGALSPKDKFPDSDGNLKVSAAQYVFNIYAEGDNAKAVHERSKGSVRAQVSKIKQIIDASAKAEPQNFRGALARAVDMRKGLFSGAVEQKKIKPAFDAYVDMARRLLKQDEDLTDDDIQEANVKSDKAKDTSVLGELKKAYQVLKRLLNNESPDKPRIYSNDPHFDMINTMHDNLLAVIRGEEPDYDVPKPGKEETNGDNEEEGLTSEEETGANEDEELEAPTLEPEATPEAEAPPVTPEVQPAGQETTTTQQAAE